MSGVLDRPKPEFYEDVMRFVEQFKATDDIDEQNEIVNAWVVWKSLNNIGDDDWGNVRFVVEMQREMLDTYERMFKSQENTIASYERILDIHEKNLAEYKNRAEKLGMYAGYLEEIFLGRPGPSDFPAS